MKKLLLLAGAATLFATPELFAQETIVVADETIVLEDVPCQTNYYTTKHDNWFINVGAGMNMPVVEDFKDAKHITAVYNLGFGKWFSPYFGWRLDFQGGSIHYANMNPASGSDMAHAKSVTGNLDIMWDFLNSVGGVNTKRVFSIVPFIGLGGTYTFNYKNIDPYWKNMWTLPVSAGLQFDFRLCNYVDLFLKARANFYGDNYNGIAAGKPIDIDFTAMAGLTFNIGGSSFRSFNPCDYTNYINGLNDQINALRGDLAVTAAALAAAEAQLPCPEVVVQETNVVEEVVPTLLSTVRFSIDSSRVTAMEKVNVYNVAKWLQDNPSMNVVINGYADKDTGTAAYNMALSQRRAEAVQKILVNEYGIAKDRLSIVAQGSNTQPYNVNNWNRIVVFQVAE